MSFKMTFSQKSILTVAFLLMSRLLPGQIGVSDRINQDYERGPSFEALEQAAQNEVERGNYFGAMRYYKTLLNAEPLNARILAAYGDAAIRYAALDSAEVAFQTIVDNKLTGPDGLALLRLGEVRYRMGNYAGASKVYRQFLFEDKPPAATESSKLTAEKRLEDCEWAMAAMANPVTDPGLFNLLDSNINTPQFSEHAPYLLGDRLYFSSPRFPFLSDRVFPRRSLNKVMSAGGPLLTEAAQLESFNEEGRHITHTTFNSTGDVVYYSNCEFIGKSYEVNCEIYRRKRLSGGDWGPAERLPDNINLAGYTNTQPAVGAVPGEKYEMLFFSSNRPGGKGGKDIWCCKIEGGQFFGPENVAAINTPGDDVTPFYHPKTATLYFSSDSLTTMGGFDVYRASWNGSAFAEPVNIGYPVNSGANDVFYMLTPDGRTAFLSSNRRGSFNQSEEGCCYDIYQADYLRPRLSGMTFLRKKGIPTDQVLGYSSMTLVETDTPNPRAFRVEVGENGKFDFDLLPGKNYMLIGEKRRFSSDTIRLSTPPRPWRQPIVAKLYLEPATPQLLVRVFDKESRQPVQGATTRLFDLGQYLSETQFEPAFSLEPVTQTNSNSNRFEYPLDADHHYKVVASKFGYTVDSSGVISTKGLTGTPVIETDIFLSSGLSFKAYTVNRINNDTLFNVNYRLLELPAEKHLESYSSLAGKDFNTIIAYENRYRIIAAKDGFSSDSIDFSTIDLPRREFQQVVQELRLRPLRLDAYLPIPLYFDNDEPDRRTVARATKKEYRAAYVDYIRRKEEFIEQYTKGMTEGQLLAETDSINRFFEDEVRGGWNRLMEFSEVLYEMLSRGDSIEITLKGYASPRAGALYNKYLTDRRVSSVYNHFNVFDGSIYRKFTLSGQLVIKREANGEAKAPKDVSDDIRDDRNSIYAVHASRERRLEIVGVKVNQEKKQ